MGLAYEACAEYVIIVLDLDFLALNGKKSSDDDNLYIRLFVTCDWECACDGARQNTTLVDGDGAGVDWR